MSSATYMALALSRPPEPALESLLVALNRRCALAMFEPGIADEFRVAIVDEVDAVGVLPVPVRYAVWISPSDHAVSDATRASGNDAVELVLSTVDDVVDAAGGKGRLVPELPPSTSDARPIPPFVRARLRAARGLPAVAIASFGVEQVGLVWCGMPSADDLVDTAFAVASVVAVVGRDIVRALAWGAPCVTDPDTASAVGLTEADDVAIGPRHALLATAQEIAIDDARSARMSRASRQLYESRFDDERVVLDVLRRLEIMPRGRARLVALIDELGGPADSRSARRAAELVGELR